MFDKLVHTVAAGGNLARKGSLLNLCFVIGAGDADYKVTIRDGAVVAVDTGPFVMPSWEFRIAAPRAEWETFLQATPPPGSHDIIAMLRRGVLTFEGNLHPLMAHLMYFKRLLASLRPVEVQP